MEKLGSTIIAATVALLAMTTIIGTASASAATSTTPLTLRYSGSGAVATNYAEDECRGQFFMVSISDMILGLDGLTSEPGPFRWGYVAMDTWDECAGTSSTYIGYLDTAIIKFSGMSGARVVAQVPTREMSTGEDGPTASIDLTFTPSSKVGTMNGNSNDGVVYTDANRYRSATVTGSASIGSLKFPGATLAGALFSSTYGYVQYRRPAA